MFISADLVTLILVQPIKKRPNIAEELLLGT